VSLADIAREGSRGKCQDETMGVGPFPDIFIPEPPIDDRVLDARGDWTPPYLQRAVLFQVCTMGHSSVTSIIIKRMFWDFGHVTKLNGEFDECGGCFPVVVNGQIELVRVTRAAARNISPFKIEKRFFVAAHLKPTNNNQAVCEECNSNIGNLNFPAQPNLRPLATGGIGLGILVFGLFLSNRGGIASIVGCVVTLVGIFVAIYGESAWRLWWAI
jgi:hypothetical protein